MASITKAFRGSLLRGVRERAGLLQREVAALLTERGVQTDQSVVSQWENNRQAPLVPTLKALADVLGVAVDHLLDDEETKP
ncbi:MAG TPA: helix-turn-helix transcriptional regulator [Pseudonocardiaceae bacterium]|jgi:transcriptional regulator with XRE-family HTH domain|nr:helix-turn-helix transcriptional regulator [Pseudonocardiaceae bacterium]